VKIRKSQLTPSGEMPTRPISPTITNWFQSGT
jgi:hypothetical protein